MKQKTFFLLFFALSLIFVQACIKAGKLSEKFYDAYNNKDYSTIEQLSHKDAGDFMKNLMKGHFKQYGKVESFKQYNVHTYTKNGTQITNISYKCNYEKTDKTIYEKIKFVKNDNGDLKILAFIYSPVQAFVDNYENYKEEALNTAEDFHNYLSDDDIDKITSMLDDKSNKDLFIEILNNKRNYYGKIKQWSWEATETNYNSEKEKPIVKNIYKCSTDKDKEYFEEIWLIKTNDDFKIYDYYFADTYENLEEMKK